jgi:hypothetical protein
MRGLRAPATFAFTVVVLLGAAIHAPGAGAQGDAVFTPAEAQAYKTWYDANQAGDLTRALPLGATYLRTYPSGRYASYLRGWLPEVRRQLFAAAVPSRNVETLLRLGREGLAESPDDVFYVYWLAVGLRSAELGASPPGSAHEAETVDFTRRAIALVEAGKVPGGVEPARWNAKTTLAYLHETLSLVEERHERWEAAAELAEKAATLDPTSPEHVLDCGRLHQQSYLGAVRSLQAIPDADRLATPPKPEVQVVVDRVNREADAVVDCWARFMALTQTANPFGETRTSVEKALGDLYRYRHPDDPAGLAKLIEARRSALVPGTAGSGPAPRPTP